ncbi:hypothetical protein L7F22_043268 [Adiantum nelumboides]|nr:hypothetical protein [Adiantum nelumboides]
MAASAPVLGTTQDAPRPITWTYELTPEDETEMQTAIEYFSGRTLVGRLVGTTPSRPTVREWIESALGGSTVRILELSMMTAGLFLLQLSDSVSTDALLARSPISSGSRLLVFQRWTPQFDQDEFDRQQQIPRFPVTLSLPSLPIFMRRCIPRMAARWGIVIPGSLVSEIGTPRIQIWNSMRKGLIRRSPRCEEIEMGIYDIFCKAAYSSLKAKSSSIVSAKNWADALDAAVSAVSKYGGASTGFRTMLDALIPAAACLHEKLNLGEDAERAFLSAAKAAYEGAESTVRMQAQAGRSSYIAPEVLLTVPDPGAMAAAAWFREAATAVAEYHNIL